MLLGLKAALLKYLTLGLLEDNINLVLDGLVDLGLPTLSNPRNTSVSFALHRQRLLTHALLEAVSKEQGGVFLLLCENVVLLLEVLQNVCLFEITFVQV